ncbi:hypothetical protein TWF696_007960 [Orbilia brochopaga]|uniref:DUF3074 domain-containing protein n=1 Tax=Orbilia brochopaga TaxID=3140254 RepID=A0AAV9UQ56_9PEZI
MAHHGVIKASHVPLDTIPKAGDELNTYLKNVVNDAHNLINLLTSPPRRPWKFNFKKSSRYGNVEVCSQVVKTEEYKEPKARNGGNQAQAHAERGNGEQERGETQEAHDLETEDQKTVGKKLSRTEYWFSRHSVHDLDSVGAREGGDCALAWDDFTNYLFNDHAEHELEYAPTVKRVDKIIIEGDWDLSTVSIPGWQVTKVAAYGIHHHFPWPLSERVFPILLILATAVSRRELMVISMPIKVASDVKGTNIKTQEIVTVISPKATVGQYVAVERVMFQPATTNDAKPNVIWDMATASDASGNIPMAVQRMGVGREIFKDVEAFLDYANKKAAT